jgi:hypothetical protein
MVVLRDNSLQMSADTHTHAHTYTHTHTHTRTHTPVSSKLQCIHTR